MFCEMEIAYARNNGPMMQVQPLCSTRKCSEAGKSCNNGNAHDFTAEDDHFTYSCSTSSLSGGRRLQQTATAELTEMTTFVPYQC